MANAKGDRFLRLLEFLLLGAMGMLLVVGAAIAHDPYGAASDDARSTESRQSADAVSMRLPLSSFYVTATVNAPLDRSWASGTDTVPYGDDLTDLDPRDGCCATACHAAVTDLGLGSLRPSYPTRIDPPARSAVLAGRSQGPGDRPPIA